MHADLPSMSTTMMCCHRCTGLAKANGAHAFAFGGMPSGQEAYSPGCIQQRHQCGQILNHNIETSTRILCSTHRRVGGTPTDKMRIASGALSSGCPAAGGGGPRLGWRRRNNCAGVCPKWLIWSSTACTTCQVMRKSKSWVTLHQKRKL